MSTTALSATAVAEAEDTARFRAVYIPPPPPSGGRIWVKAPRDDHGRPVCADLHVSPQAAEELIEALQAGIKAYLEYEPDLH